MPGRPTAPVNIDPVRIDERDALLRIAVRTGLFTADDAEGLLGGVLDALAAGESPPGHAAVACRGSRGGPAAGWCHFAPDPYVGEVWNVWWLGVLPKHRGTGMAHALLAHVEQAAAAAGVRVVVIETSDHEPLARARYFYSKVGYVERGRIPHFYADGESKVIFSRVLGSTA